MLALWFTLPARADLEEWANRPPVDTTWITNRALPEVRRLQPIDRIPIVLNEKNHQIGIQRDDKGRRYCWKTFTDGSREVGKCDD